MKFARADSRVKMWTLSPSSGQPEHGNRVTSRSVGKTLQLDAAVCPSKFRWILWPAKASSLKRIFYRPTCYCGCPRTNLKLNYFEGSFNFGNKKDIRRHVNGYNFLSEPSGITVLCAESHCNDECYKDSLCLSQIKHQLDATLCRFYFCRVTLHVSGVKHPSSGVLKNWYGGPWYRWYSCR